MPSDKEAGVYRGARQRMGVWCDLKPAAYPGEASALDLR